MITIAQTKRPDWAKIRAEYIGGGISQRKLAKKHGVTYSSLRRRAEADGWAEERRDVERKASAKAAQKTAEEKASNAAKYERARGLAFDRLIRALERMPESGGSHSRQTITDGGKRITVDHDLLSIISALEKLGANMTLDKVDDPVVQMLKRWDDAAGI